MESRVKPNLLLVVVKYVLDTVWYLSAVFAVIAVIFIIGKLNSPPTDFLVNVEYHGTYTESYTPACEEITSAEFRPTHGKLHMSGGAVLFQKTIWIYIFSLLVFALYLVFMFSLRKIFTGLLHQSPFCMDTVKRIRVLSCCLVVFNLLLLVWDQYFLHRITTLSSFPEYFSISIPGDFKYILIAAVVYILADIFKYGFLIQEENNKFV